MYRSSRKKLCREFRLDKHSLHRIFVSFYCVLSFRSLSCKSYYFFVFSILDFSILVVVPESSPSRDGDFTVHVKDTNRPSLLTPFRSVLVSISVFIALSTVFYSIKFSRQLTLFLPVLPVLYLSYWSFQLYIPL